MTTTIKGMRTEHSRTMDRLQARLAKAEAMNTSLAMRTQQSICEPPSVALMPLMTSWHLAIALVTSRPHALMLFRPHTSRPHILVSSPNALTPLRPHAWTLFAP